jgi:hypothetical protein
LSSSAAVIASEAKQSICPRTRPEKICPAMSDFGNPVRRSDGLGYPASRMCGEPIGKEQTFPCSWQNEDSNDEQEHDLPVVQS